MSTPERLGKLYEEMRFAIESSPTTPLFRRDMDRLRERYPSADVDWMFEVVAQDMFNAGKRPLCERCGDTLTDLGAHGVGCPTCADAEIEALNADLEASHVESH